MNTTPLKHAVDRLGNSIGTKMEITSPARSPSPTDLMDVDSPRRPPSPTITACNNTTFNNKDILQPLRIYSDNKQHTGVKEKLPPLSSLFPRDKFPPKLTSSMQQQQQSTPSYMYSGVHNLAKLPQSFLNTNSATYSNASTLPQQQLPAMNVGVQQASTKQQQVPAVGSLSSLVTSSRVGDSAPPSQQQQQQQQAKATATNNNPLLSNYLYFASSAASTAQSDPAGGCTPGLTPKQQQQLSQPIIREGGWTEQEQRQFLLGVKECGWGSWKEISNKYVRSRTRKQVASHAQKFLIKVRKLQMEKLGVNANSTPNSSTTTTTTNSK